MAEAAAILQFESPGPEIFSPAQFIDADTVPELRFLRRRAGQEAARILGENRQFLIDGEFDKAPIPVDAIGTARRVVEAKKRFGPDSEEYEQAFGGLLLDSGRLMGEAARKNTWEYFAEAPQQFEPETGEYFAHGVPLLDIVTGGLSPVSEPEEQTARISEFVEEHTYHALPRIRAIGRLGLSETVSVTTISQCTQWAIEAYQANSKGSFGGYVPEIEKLMIRGVRFAESSDRFEEQVGVAGTYITHEVIMAVLEQDGAVPEGQSLTKAELRGKQFINPDGGGVLDFVQRLDLKASELSGKRIFMGEEVSADYEIDYTDIKRQAEVRRLQLAAKSRQLAEHLIVLQESGTDRWAAEAIVEAFVKKSLFGLARQDPEQAAIIFDKATADGVREIMRLQALGQTKEARDLEATVEKNAPPVSYCGAGSCDLEAVRQSSPDAKKAKELGLSGELLHDKKRTCPKCHAAKVHYDMNGGKACTRCGYHNTGGKAAPSKENSHKKQEKTAVRK